MKFVLENKDVLFDFQYELYRQKNYYDWLNAGKSKELQTEMVVCTENELKKVCPDANLKEWCPVGSVEFCVKWYKDVWGLAPKPKNVPKELIKLCNRKIMDFSDLNDAGWNAMPYLVFAKSTEVIKSEWNGMKDNRDMWYVDGDHKFHFFQVSEVMTDITSEWRCFIYDRKLVDLKCYSGDPFCIPNKEYIEECIDEYKSSPIAYTLDVCTRENHSNEIVEVHDFFSCGLYGFDDPKYPIMLWRWFKEYTNK